MLGNTLLEDTVMALLKVNESKCTQCGLCAAVCGLDLIYLDERKYPTELAVADLECVRCGHCVSICPTGSLTHVDVPIEQCLPLEKSLSITFTQTAQLIEGRRSIRMFKDKKVPRQEIERIIQVARHSPTGHNSQGVQWLIISNPDAIKNLSKIGFEWMKWAMKNIPVLVPIIGRLTMLQESGKDVFLRDAPTIIFTYGKKDSAVSSIDCISAATYFDIAASSAGLGCCWNALLLTAATSFPLMVKAVALPEGYTPYGCLMLGYPKYQYTRVPFRKPANIVFRT
jgi:nitroreductase/Pyruvate/2-oxoacid:ferredoxin oxidoreductase delta subunit